MAANSNIEWTDHTFNPWVGCMKVSPGCKHCYAEILMTRKPRWERTWGPPETTTRIKTSDANWRKPIQWDKQAAKVGQRHKVFCASLADVFEDNPMLESWRDDLWKLITETGNLDWLLLTKRPENVNDMIPPSWSERGLPFNVWIGTSVEDQNRAKERVPHLLRIPASIKFLSIEPLLGPVDLYGLWPEIDWVIVGGESGTGARPMHPDWARGIRDQCLAADIPFFFKQWGRYSEEALINGVLHGAISDDPDGKHLAVWPDGKYTVNWEPGPTMKAATLMFPFGKKAAGRVLDGRTWNEMPAAAQPEGGER